MVLKRMQAEDELSLEILSTLSAWCFYPTRYVKPGSLMQPEAALLVWWARSRRLERVSSTMTLQ